jgi:adenylate kinase family enzyme
MTSLDSLGPALLVLLGPPGSGKSTVVKTVLDRYPALGHFAVRRQFVKEKQRRSDLWLAAAESQEQRRWIPDEIVIEAFRRRLDAQLPGGMLIEGLPANARQAHLLVGVVAARNREIDRVIYLDAPDAVCMERMRGRQVCLTCDGGISQAALSDDAPGRCARCGTGLSRRPDDEDVAFAERLRLHRLHIDGILHEFGRDQVTFVDGTASPAETVAAVLQCLARLSPR